MIIQVSEGQTSNASFRESGSEGTSSRTTNLKNCTALFHPVNPWDSMARHASAFPAHVGWMHSIYGIIVA